MIWHIPYSSFLKKELFYQPLLNTTGVTSFFFFFFGDTKCVLDWISCCYFMPKLLQLQSQTEVNKSLAKV